MVAPAVNVTDRLSPGANARTKLRRFGPGGCSPPLPPCFPGFSGLLCTADTRPRSLKGMKGRPPTAKHILKLRGSKHAKNREELGTTPPAAIEPPAWLKPRAKEIFAAVVVWLTRMGTLAESDEAVITRYATTYVMWEFAAKKLQEIDAAYVEITNNDGSLRFVRASGMATQFRDTGEQLRHLETVLGLTPADRTRLGYGAVKVVNDPVDALFDEATG
jgi:P27 family predicted phage terminase small subunit